MADFLGGFFPPAPTGKAPLWLYQRAQRRPRCPPALSAEQSASSRAAQPAAVHGVLSSQRGLGKGRGSTGGLCPMHGAPSCERCRATGQGVASCCRNGHIGHSRGRGAPTGRGSCVTRPSRRGLPQAERVSTARGMHGWLRRLSELENQDENDRDNQSAPSAPSSAAQEQGTRTGPSKGRKRTSAGGLSGRDLAPREEPQGSRAWRRGITATGSHPPLTGHPAP